MIHPTTALIFVSVLIPLFPVLTASLCFFSSAALYFVNHGGTGCLSLISFFRQWLLIPHLRGAAHSAHVLPLRTKIEFRTKQVRFKNKIKKTFWVLGWQSRFINVNVAADLVELSLPC
jgi:hypothetical protein